MSDIATRLIRLACFLMFSAGFVAMSLSSANNSLTMLQRKIRNILTAFRPDLLDSAMLLRQGRSKLGLIRIGIAFAGDCIVAAVLAADN